MHKHLNSFRSTAILAWITTFFCFGVVTSSAHPICKISHYDESTGMSQRHNTQILQDPSGLIWISTWNGLNSFDGYEFRTYKSRIGDGSGMRTDRIRNMMLSPDGGSIYCNLDDIFFRFDLATYRYSPITDSTLITELQKQVPSTPVYNLEQNHGLYEYTDPNGYQWQITSDKGVFLIDPITGKREQRVTPDAFHNKSIRHAFPDRQGNLWLQTWEIVFKLSFHDTPIESFPAVNPSSIRHRCLYADSRGYSWLATNGDKTIRVYSPQNELLGYLGPDGALHKRPTQFGANVYSIQESSNGDIWMGSRLSGLFRMRPTDKSGTRFDLLHFMPDPSNPDAINSRDVYDIIEDRYGRLWLATFEGLNLIPNPTAAQPRFIHMNNSPHVGFPTDGPRRIRHLHITADNILLAATSEGLLACPLSSEDATHFEIKHHHKDAYRPTSLNCDATVSIAEDSYGQIFIGTESGGINQILSTDLLADTLEFKHITAENALPQDVIVALLPIETTDGTPCNRLWVVCSNRLTILETTTGKTQNFDQDFFFRNCDFSDAHPIRLSDGRYLFGLRDGAITLNENQLSKSKSAPPIVLTDIAVQNRSIDKAPNAIDTITLFPQGRNLSVRFAALNYSNPQSVEYEFFLSTDTESEPTWNKLYSDRSITLMDLKPGDYTLGIRSSNADGQWVDNTRLLTIIVPATFWETGWATALYILIALLFFMAITYTAHYIHAIKRKQKETLRLYLELVNRPQDSARLSIASAAPHHRPDLSGEDEDFIQSFLQYIDANMHNENLSIGDIAYATANSRSNLYRKIKNIFGITPIDFLREARIKKACSLLKDGDKSVSEVASACGFSDPKYFSRCFKTSVGMSPSDYKMQS